MKKFIAPILAGAVAVGSALGAYTANYTPSDMPHIATDILGEGGVQLKVYMPLIILGFVATGLVTTVAVIRARLR
jgi:hypothetical protein